jgi:anaerobic C4-dicarboxylate transporter
MKNRITQFDRFVIRSTFVGICITIIAVMNTKSKIETKNYFQERIESLELDSIRTHEMLENYSINHKFNRHE